MTARLVEEMPFEDYLAHPALSASGMKRILDSPARFRHEQDEPRDTPTLHLGRMIHTLAFDQPHKYTAKDWDGRTTEGKAKAKKVAEEGREIVDATDLEIAEGIREALRKNALASSILYPEGVRHEVSAFWTDEETGVECRCRFDALGPNAIGDLKSTTSARPSTFIRSAAEYDYLTAAAHYRAGAKAVGLGDLPFLLVAAEKRRPYFLSVVGITEADLELAERLRRKAIRRFAECVEADEWPDYTTEITYPDAPTWWRYKAEDETYEEMEIA